MHSRSILFLWRIVLALVLAGFVIWLLVQPKQVSRKTSVEHAVLEGRFAKLSKDDQADLGTRLEHLVRAAGFENPVFLNQPFQKGGLNFFVTTPETSELTRCGHGNAVYDGPLDAVFIDREIVFPTRIQSTFASSLVIKEDHPDQASRTYFDYVVLHELGHRALHQRSAAVSDVTTAGKTNQIESEADTFAIEKLRRLVPSPGTSDRVRRPLGRFKAPPGMETSLHDTVVLELSDMAYELTRSMLFGDTPFSPFTTDKYHPAFVDRMSILLNQAVSEATNARIKTYVQLAAEHLRRIQAVHPRLMAEIHVDEPILRADFSQTELLIIGKKGTLFRFPASRFDNRHSQKLASIAETVKRPIGEDTAESIAHGVLHSFSSNSVIVVVPRKGIFDLETLKWLPVGTDVSPAHWEFSLSSGQRWIAVSRNTNTVYHLFNGTKHVVSIAEERMISRLIAKGAPQGCSLQLNSNLDAFFAIIFSRHPITFKQQLVGVARLDKTDLQPGKIMRFETDAIAEMMSGGTIVIAPHPNEQLVYFVVDTFEPYGPHRKPYEIQVWRLHPDRSPERVSQYRYALDILGEKESPFDWLTTSHPSVLSCRSINSGFICHAWADSIYAFDSASNHLSVLFHPAEAWVSGSPNEYLAAYVNGGYKCFVIKP